MGARAEDATVRDVDDFASPGLKRRRTTVGAWAEIEKRDTMHEGERPMIARKSGAMEERDGGVLASFDTGFGFAVAGRIATTSAFHDTMLRSDGNTEFRAAPEFTSIVSAPPG
jgi:hypothetical protein